jgi:hypothetical protein
MFPCNHKAMGNWEQQIFRINLVKEIGKSRVEDLEGSLLHYKQSPTLFKVYTYEIKEWIEKYQSKIDEIFAKNPSLKG